MKALTPALLKKFLRLAGEELQGEWVLIGGTVLPLLGDSKRSTTDIDIVALDSKAAISQTLKLMEIAESLGLSPETINQAGAYFYSKAQATRGDLALLHEGKNARIFRPGPTLYLLLKIPRLSESDLSDCLGWLKRVKKLDEKVDGPRVLIAIRKSMKACEPTNQAKAERLKELTEALKKLGP